MSGNNESKRNESENSKRGYRTIEQYTIDIAGATNDQLIRGKVSVQANIDNANTDVGKKYYQTQMTELLKEIDKRGLGLNGGTASVDGSNNKWYLLGGAVVIGIVAIYYMRS